MQRGPCEQAIEYLNKSLQVYLKSVPPNYPPLATLCKYLGLAYSNRFDDQSEQTFMNFDKALEVTLKNPPLKNQPMHGIICRIRILCCDFKGR
ncbi:unnamed protein product [Didymodactylos carnosus]|uniref:Uncharacterized protein n=1 Tax=Didymodactylos carnosus TaxID=1234261 RepID=A0A815Z0V9_9BILA|nr:unnamed protein product [Didymodactylos carnosus]CAF1576694.1 unnamed protein product [Didymodactylos carnosus]CAF3796148.1 unnamed protein product [Didymodactylos carnosus]CAF4441925.1 unnamed protein product [Didymodactylos carnosus]